jgi:signal transduction histidine kinase/HAMP domain-containing protein
MTLSLRQRIILTLAPLLALLGILGVTGFVLLYRLGGSIDLILRENYASVIAMERLNEALERIDSSFQFAIAGEDAKARAQYRANWKSYRDSLDIEQHNITVPGEGELVAQLEVLTERYREQGEAFYAVASTMPNGDPIKERLRRLYFGRPNQKGLLQTFEEIKAVAREILRINQDNMEQASRDSQALATHSLLWFGVGMAAAVVLAALLALHTIRTTLQPIRAVTQSALAIGTGNLDQVVPVKSRDELGQLAGAFNTMARQLREYRQTSYARLLRAQRTSQAAIDSFPDPVLVVDSEGLVEMANPAARRLFGTTLDGSKSAPVADLRSPPMLPWLPPEGLRLPLERALKEQQSYRPEGFDHALPLRVDGQEQLFLPHVASIRDPYGNTLGAAVLLQNVTRFRLLDQAKSDLVATVSHELKTPLTSVRLALHLLLEETVGPLTPKQVELLLDARDNAERLLARVNNLLDLTRFERGREQLNIQPEAPADLLRTAADAIRPRAQDKGITLTVQAPADLPPVAVDPLRLGHALGNLLDNALTYTDRGGRIELSAAAVDGDITLTVADTGVGIPPEHLPHVFERFYRIPGHSRHGGTGLGLALVREIVTAHGGSVTCESQPGAGAVFHVTLPAWQGDRK